MTPRLPLEGPHGDRRDAELARAARIALIVGAVAAALLAWGLG